LRVLVTGASGFLGSHLLAHLLARGDEVVGTYAGSESAARPGIELYPVEITDRSAMAELVERVDPSVVIHLAGLSHVGASWRRVADYYQVNVVGTETLLAVAAGRRVVLASSAEVYGPVPESEQPLSEGCPLFPPSPYALTKACAERMVLAAGGVVARTFNLIGPGQAANFALPTFARQLAAIARGEQEPVLKVGNLSARRDFLHVEDGARAYRLLAETGLPGGVYNVASGEALSMEAMLSRLIAVSGVEAQVETDPTRLRPVDLPLLQGNNHNLRQLGWAPEHTVEEALRELWESVR
jgi:GDP-4-dehydro-6-deoxy-D-mannose reductase